MTNSQNMVKNHESSIKKANHAEQVSNILSNVENTPYALRGATVKTILYSLFSVIAAVELSAALFFYVASLGVPKAVAMVVCGVLAFGFHALLHSILTDTSKGIVFGKRTESGAMSNEVTANIVLSIVLLLIAACSVFFVGKKGFAAYRATQYEQKTEAEKVAPAKQLDPSVLAGKNGKVAAWKLEALTDLAKAQTKATEATTAHDESSQTRYDATTATITDIVGASAFLIELLLALLAYTIATAKKAAAMEEIARRNASSNEVEITRNDISPNDISPNDLQSPPSQQQKRIGFSDNKATNNGNEGRAVIKGFVRRNDISLNDPQPETPSDISLDDLPENMGVCPVCEKKFEKKNYRHTYDSDECRTIAWETKHNKKFKKGTKA